MYKHLTTIILLIVLSLPTTAHEFHTSLVQMDYNAKTKSFEISLRVFSDDMEKAISLSNALNGFRIDKHAEADQLLEKYLHQMFILKQKGKTLDYKYLGKQIENDVTWIYIEVPAANCHSIGVECKLLTDVFKDQANIVNWQCNGDKKSFLFDKSTTQHITP
jgi:hypothetical protein